MLKPKFGQWVIFDHCLPFDVTHAVANVVFLGNLDRGTADTVLGDVDR